MGQGQRIQVLLVDDEEEFLASAARGLSRRGFEVEVASTGQIALARLADRRFDVIVIDVQMPGMNGLELMREIAAGWPGLPVIVLTGQANLEQSVELCALKIFEYLTKPCDLQKIAETVRRAADIDWHPESVDIDPSTLSRIRLLIVDDERDFLDGLARTLGRRGMQVMTAENGREALALIASNTFDVALLDVRMPGMDGIDLLEQIRRIAPEIRVLLLTGHPTLNQAIKGVRAGAYDFLLKPQDIDTLAHKIVCAFEDRSHK